MAKRKKPLTQPVQDDLPKYKEDINAFSVPVEEDKDFISRIPSEILHEIFSYLVIDHDPERAAKIYSKNATLGANPHVLISLAAMSHHFHDHIEDFSRRHLIKYKVEYKFKTNAELEENEAVPRRRSERIKQNSQGQDNRCYRIELTRELTWRCFGCDLWTSRRAIMANGVACCEECDVILFNGMKDTMTLTDAKKLYDLRDWMLLPSRNPRLRAKHGELPVIAYGTVRSGTPCFNGMTISYRFFREDVEKLATAAHGDVRAHLGRKEQERYRRKAGKRDVEHRKLKVRYHDDQLGIVTGKDAQQYHKQRLEYYEDPECTEGYNSRDADHMYGNYDDVHKRLCVRNHCPRCEHEKRMKYSPEWMKEFWEEEWVMEREMLIEEGFLTDDEDMWF